MHELNLCAAGRPSRRLDLPGHDREVGGSNLGPAQGLISEFPKWGAASVGRSNPDASNCHPISRARLGTDVTSP